MTASVQPQEIFQAIGTVLHPDPGLRQQAERYVNDAYKKPGCATALLAVAAENQIELGLRQLAAVLLKHLIHRHWTSGNPAFEHPEIAEQEKSTVRPKLLELLFQVPSNVSTPLAVCVTSIATWDFPEEWPDLLQNLLSAVRVENSNDAQEAQRAVALQTLSVMAEEVPEDFLPAVSRDLLPVAVQGMCSGSMPPTLLRRALSVITICMKRTTLMSSEARKEMKQQLKSSKQLVPALCTVVVRDYSSADTKEFAVLAEALKILQELLCVLGKFMTADLPKVMGAVWRLFEAAPAAYEALVLSRSTDADDGEQAGDGETGQGGEVVTFETVVEQLYEFLLTVLGAASLQEQLKSALQVIVFNTITFMQMTADQEEEWSSDANCYVLDEDVDAFGARSSCEMLLSELQERYPKEMATTVTNVVAHRMQESLQRKAAGDASWWRLREASLAALGTQSPTDSCSSNPAQETNAILSSILEHDLSSQDVPPFLRGRALRLAAKVTSCTALPTPGGSPTPGNHAQGQAVGVAADMAAMFMSPTIECLGSRHDMVVRVCACRAVTQLLPLVPAERMQPLLPVAYSVLLELMQKADQDVLSLVLVSLNQLVRAHPEPAHRYAASICAGTLSVFQSVVSDAQLLESFTTLLSTLAAAPGCLPLMAQTGLPTLVATLQSGNRRDVPAGDTTLLTGTLDLLCSFVSESDPCAPPPTLNVWRRSVAKQIYSSCAQPACELLLHSGDENIIQSACEFFRKLFLVGGEQVLTWEPGGPSQALQMLVVVLTFVLNPKNVDAAAIFAPGLALQSLFSLPSAARELAPKLLQLLVVKATCCEMEELRGALLPVIARIMVDQDVESQLAMLASCEVPPAGSNPVASFLACWTDHAAETLGAYPQRLCALVLTKLAASKHASLSQIQVPGRLHYQEGVGVRTRRQKATIGSGIVRHPTPLPARLMHAIVQLLRAADEPAEEADGDWRSLLYGAQSDDDSEDDDGSLGSQPGAAADGTSIESLGRVTDMDPAAVMALAEGGGDDENALWRCDPLYAADIAGAALGTLVSLMNSDRGYFDALLTELNEDERMYLQTAFQSHGAATQAQQA